MIPTQPEVIALTFGSLIPSIPCFHLLVSKTNQSGNAVYLVSTTKKHHARNKN